MTVLVLVTLKLGWVPEGGYDFQQKLLANARGLLFIKMKITHLQALGTFAALGHLGWGDANKVLFRSAQTASAVSVPQSSV